MASTDERGGPVVDAARADTTLAGDDIAVLPDRKDREPSRRTRALVVAAAIVTVVVIVVVIVAFGAKSSSTTRVSTTNNAAQTPTAGKAPVPTPQPAKPKKVVTKPAAKKVVLPPVVNVPGTIGTPITATIPTASPPPSPQPTTPPALLGPKVLQWHVTPAGTITIRSGGSVTMSVTVTNPTANPAYMPTPLGCLVMPRAVCPQHTDQVAAGKSASASFTLHASDFSATPTKVYIGGYYAVTVKVA